MVLLGTISFKVRDIYIQDYDKSGVDILLGVIFNKRCHHKLRCISESGQSYQREHELILFWDAKLFHSGSNIRYPWHLKKGLAHVLVSITYHQSPT